MRARGPAAAPRHLLLALAFWPTPATAQTHVAWSLAPNAGNGPDGGRAAMAFAQASLSNTGSGLSDVLWMYGGISQMAPVFNYSQELWGYTAATGSWQLGKRANNPPLPRGRARKS